MDVQAKWYLEHNPTVPNTNDMPVVHDKNLRTRFLKALCKIKNWSYHDTLEVEKKEQVRRFVEVYIFKEICGVAVYQRVSYKRLQSVVTHPTYTPVVKAITSLLEYSFSEEDFIHRHEKILKQHLPKPASSIA